jgi:hypothetical protein
MLETTLMWIGVCTAIFGLINILLYLTKNLISVYRALRALRDIGEINPRKQRRGRTNTIRN